MKKNVVLLVMDTARASDTRYVQENLTDSTLAKLAAEGTTYSEVYTNSPWTLPSHTSMFTGTYTSKHGTHAGHKSYNGQFPTLAEELSAVGYETVGITNNAWVTNEFGLARGFERFRKVWQYIQTETDLGEIKLTTHGTEQIMETAKALLNGDLIANLLNTFYGQFVYRRSDYGAARTNTLVEQWLRNRETDNPFFLFLNYLEPHLDYQPPKEWVQPFLPDNATYKDAMAIPQEPWEYIAGTQSVSDSEFELLQALYRGEIAYLDHQIGVLQALLDQHGEWDDTVFVIVGDHGENIGDHGLMDHQYSVHDTLLHVPLTITGGAFAGGGESDRLVQPLDLYPTIMDIAGVSVPSHVQGMSIHPDTVNEPRKQVVAEYCSPQPTIERLSEQTGVSREELSQYDRSLRALRTSDYKLVRDSRDSVELFNMTADGETETCAEPDVQEELEGKLDAWLDSFEQNAGSGSTEMSDSTKQKLEDLGYLQ
ncbi:sulfatase [Haloarchaeobius sp. TZWSO28]|uniref:sulfatase n=1 Tax=Haloarchaeobius sp. TZWSO28 TaxID=3446119 RepID=UPI003EBAC85E